jgi:hypothetical protein
MEINRYEIADLRTDLAFQKDLKDFICERLFVNRIWLKQVLLFKIKISENTFYKIKEAMEFYKNNPIFIKVDLPIVEGKSQLQQYNDALINLIGSAEIRPSKLPELIEEQKRVFKELNN